MINVTAILLSAIGLMRVGILLLFTSIGLNYIYAVLDYNFGKGGASEMICKYALLTVLHVFLGLLIIL